MAAAADKLLDDNHMGKEDEEHTTHKFASCIKKIGYGKKVLDMDELWDHCDSIFPYIGLRLYEDGPSTLEFTFIKAGATAAKHGDSEI